MANTLDSASAAQTAAIAAQPAPVLAAEGKEYAGIDTRSEAGNRASRSNIQQANYTP